MKTGPSSAYGSVLLGDAEQGTRRLRIRVQVLLTILLVSTNLIGAGIVLVLSALVIPSPDANRATVLTLAIGVPVYVGVAIVIGATWGTASVLRALRWSIRGETPTDEERIQALGVPWFLTRIQAALWFGATVLFTVLALLGQPDRALTTGPHGRHRLAGRLRDRLPVQRVRAASDRRAGVER